MDLAFSHINRVQQSAFDDRLRYALLSTVLLKHPLPQMHVNPTSQGGQIQGRVFEQQLGRKSKLSCLNTFTSEESVGQF